MGGSTAGAIVEGSTENGMGAPGAKDRARVDEPTAKVRVQVESENCAEVDGLTVKGRVAGSSEKRALVAQQAEARKAGFFLRINCVL